MIVMRRALLALFLVEALLLLAPNGFAGALVVNKTVVDWHAFSDSANSLYTIADEPGNFSDVTLFCGFDSYDASTNTTTCFLQGTPVNVTVTPIGLVKGKIGGAIEVYGGIGGVSTDVSTNGGFATAFWVKVINPNTADGYPDLFRVSNGTLQERVEVQPNGYLGFAGLHSYIDVRVSVTGRWLFIVLNVNYSSMTATLYVYDENELVATKTAELTSTLPKITSIIPQSKEVGEHDIIRDDLWVYNRPLTQDEIKLLYLAGRKQFSGLATLSVVSTSYDSTANKYDITVNVSLPAGAQYLYVPAGAIVNAPVVQNWSTGHKLINVSGKNSVLITIPATVGQVLEGVNYLGIWTDEGLYSYGQGSMTIPGQSRLVDGVTNTIAGGQVTALAWDDPAFTGHPISGFVGVSAGGGSILLLQDTQEYIKLQATVTNPIKLNMNNLVPLVDYNVLLNGDKDGSFKTDDFGSATYVLDSSGAWELGLPEDVYASFADNMTKTAFIVGVVFIIVGWAVELTPNKWDDNMAKYLFAIGAIALALVVIRLILYMV